MTLDGRIGLRAVLLAAVLSGCGEESRCEFVERAAGLDETFGSIEVGARRGELSGTYTGVLTWERGAQQLNEDPPIGQTSFTLTLELGDSATLFQGVRVGGDANERLDCPDEVHYGAVVELSTGDGVLDERWEATAVAHDNPWVLSTVTLIDPSFSLPLALPEEEAEHLPDAQLRVDLSVLALEDEEPAVSGSIVFRASGTVDGASAHTRRSIATLSRL